MTGSNARRGRPDPGEMAKAKEAAVHYAAQRAQRERPELTARFTRLLKAIVAGKSPDAKEGMDESLREILMMEGQAAKAWGKGNFQRLQFIDDDEAGGSHRFQYLAKFSKGSVHWTFVLDRHDRLTGFSKF